MGGGREEKEAYMFRVAESVPLSGGDCTAEEATARMWRGGGGGGGWQGVVFRRSGVLS